MKIFEDIGWLEDFWIELLLLFRGDWYLIVGGNCNKVFVWCFDWMFLLFLFIIGLFLMLGVWMGI